MIPKVKASAKPAIASIKIIILGIILFNAKQPIWEKHVTELSQELLLPHL